ncbi:hypothetical protein [Halocynthiibacter sp.]|uniref:hypothetical protein n=1 Tax=Halocynthiibacter sp. TaxID=1979210 RepID=UPI003C41B26D
MFSYFDDILSPLRRVTSAPSSAHYEAKNRENRSYSKSVYVREGGVLPGLPSKPLFRYATVTTGYKPGPSYFTAFTTSTGVHAVATSPDTYYLFTPENPFELNGEVEFDLRLVNTIRGETTVSLYKIKRIGQSKSLEGKLWQQRSQFFAKDLLGSRQTEDMELGYITSTYKSQQMVSSSSKWINFQGEDLELDFVEPSYP